MPPFPTRAFYDQLAEDYHLLYADWDAAIARHGEALDSLIRRALGNGPFDVLDCSCGIGTQAIGLAAHGHRVAGSDLSPAAAARAATEAAARGQAVVTVAGDMRYLPFGEACFDVVLSADNSFAHLLSDQDLLVSCVSSSSVKL